MKLTPFACLIALLLMAAPFCLAEEGPDSSHIRQPGKDRPDLPQFLPKKPGKGLKTPRMPDQKEKGSISATFELQGVVFEGNTVFSDARLEKAAKPFLGRWVSLADLEEIRYQITRLYVDAGYINSGALIKPGQSVDDGIVVYQIQEGGLDQVKISGNKRLKKRYIENRLRPEPDAPFNVYTLQKRFQLLLEDPLIEKLDGRVRPGLEQGEALLDLDITRARPYSLALTVDNSRPPSTGAENVTVGGTLRNLTGYGDALDGAFQLSEGATDIRVGYTLPINGSHTRLSLNYSYGENSVIEEPLDLIDIESRSETAEIALNHPLIYSLRYRLALGLSLAMRESKTWLDGDPFPFTTGSNDGESKVTALRFVQSFQDRTTTSALALRSTFSLGVDMLDATVHEKGRPDSRYFAWLGQFQYAQRVGQRFGQLLFRGDLQLAEDNLLTLEQFAVGGYYSVRGYRENELVRDNGYAVSLEWRYPLMRGDDSQGREANLLEIAPFVDYGAAWNRDESADDYQLFSSGLGLLWNPSQHIRAELYAAHDIETATDKPDHDLQDEGVHFRIGLNF